ncbi:MAG: hypothetical protein ACK53L_11910, partial [Pirellulaceae bacterium]
MAQNLKPPCQRRLRQGKPSMLAKQFLKRLFLNERLVQLGNRITIQAFRNVKSIELKDLDEIRKLREIEICRCIKYMRLDRRTLQRLTAQSAFQERYTFLQTPIRFAYGPRIL